MKLSDRQIATLAVLYRLRFVRTRIRSGLHGCRTNTLDSLVDRKLAVSSLVPGTLVYEYAIAFEGVELARELERDGKLPTIDDLRKKG